MPDLIEQRQFAAVGPTQVLRCEDLLDRATRNPTHVEQQDFIEVLGHGLQIVMHDERRLARRTQGVEEPEPDTIGSEVRRDRDLQFVGLGPPTGR